MVAAFLLFVVLLVTYALALSVASDTRGVFSGVMETVMEGRYALLTSSGLLVLFFLIERHAFAGWARTSSIETHRRAVRAP